MPQKKDVHDTSAGSEHTQGACMIINSFDPDLHLPESAAAHLLGVTPRTLQAWRLRGGGPPFVRISLRCVRYRRRDLIA